ncbi:MAG: hypothetical protein ACTS80_02050 [Candidatus Hodgkinia cicadicola]
METSNRPVFISKRILISLPFTCVPLNLLSLTSLTEVLAVFTSFEGFV